MKRNVLAYLLLSIVLLTACVSGGDRRRMAQIIAEADSMNRNYVPMTSDTLLIEACRFYDRHGSANEQLKAHYLLGCVYRDLGEAPHAVECYQDAISKADTTRADCDYRTLGCVYSQMAGEFHSQLLVENEIAARYKSRRFAFMANDTINAVYELHRIAGAYILLNKVDSAETILLQVISQCNQYRFIQDKLLANLTLAYLYTEVMGKYPDAKPLLDEFELKSDLFDEHHELPPSRRQFYFYKGRYFEGVGQLDSAEYYYRKVYRPNMRFVDKNPMYQGLLSVYKKRRQADSIAKYAQLYCMVNDSSIAIKDKELTAQMAASYNYNRYQNTALKNEKKAHDADNRFFLSLIICVLLLLTVLFIAKHIRTIKIQKQQEIERLKSQLADALVKYNEKREELQLLNNLHQDEIQKIYANYEGDKISLQKECEELKKKISLLKSEDAISKHLSQMDEFFHTDTVTSIIDIANSQQGTLKKRDLKALTNTMTLFFPAFMKDLNQSTDITPLGKAVCMLVAINLRSGDIANLLDISNQQVSNHKQSLNKLLFDEDTASTLYKNLVKRYDIFAA